MHIKRIDILVVDDDPVSGHLLCELLLDAGLGVHLVKRSIDAIPQIRRLRPRMVVTDVMLSGISGLEICLAIKTDPELSNIKVVVASQKYFDADRRQAFRYGAEAYLRKPFNVDTVAGQLKHILEGNREAVAAMRRRPAEDIMPEQQPQKPDLAAGDVRVSVWGSRNLPQVMPNAHSDYGRQTACVSVETADGIYIFDGGSGIIPLGHKIVRRAWPKNIWVLLSHMHMGHIIGLPKFPCVHRPDYKINIAGAGEPDKKLKDLVQEIFYGSPFWADQHPKAEISLFELFENSYDLAEGVSLTVIYANHPSTALCLSLELNGRKIVYAPDSEVSDDSSAMEDYNEKMSSLARGADILIHDAFYSDEDYKSFSGQGHSGVSNVVKLAGEVGVRNLVLFNLNDSYNDTRLNALIQQAASACDAGKYQMRCHIAREGLTVVFKNSASKDEA